MHMKRFAYLAGALLAVVACNKTPKTEPQPVDFSQYAVRLEPVITRATETNFETGDAIGLSILRAAGDYATNAKLAYDGAAFSGDPSSPLISNTVTVLSIPPVVSLFHDLMCLLPDSVLVL